MHALKTDQKRGDKEKEEEDSSKSKKRERGTRVKNLPETAHKWNVADVEHSVCVCAFFPVEKKKEK